MPDLDLDGSLHPYSKTTKLRKPAHPNSASLLLADNQGPASKDPLRDDSAGHDDRAFFLSTSGRHRHGVCIVDPDGGEGRYRCWRPGAKGVSNLVVE